MYRETVKNNLEEARITEKKENPKAALFFLILGALLGLNAFGLLVKGKGIVAFGVSADICGFLSAAACVLFIGGAVFTLFSGIRNRRAGITSDRWDRYLESVRALGPEEEIFDRIGKLTPFRAEGKDLRYDDLLVAGTSSESVDFNFVWPMRSLTKAGIAELGSGPFLYIHATVNGRTDKETVKTDRETAERILKELSALNPDLKTDTGKGK